MQGSPVEFEFVSSDATTAASILIREPGVAAVRPLLATERFILTAVASYVASAAGSVTMFNDADSSGTPADGERMYGAGAGNSAVEYETGMAAAQGLVPKVKASAAGVVSLYGTGVIINS